LQQTATLAELNRRVTELRKYLAEAQKRLERILAAQLHRGAQPLAQVSIPQAARAILLRRGEPLKAGELARAILDQGGKTSSPDFAAVVHAALSRDATAPYGLVAYDPTARRWGLAEWGRKP